MAKQIVNTGTSANDRTGDNLRTAFNKINQNFDELYTELGLDSDGTLNLGNFVFENNTVRLTNANNDDSTATQIEIAQPVRIESDLTVGGDVVPNTANGSDLGSINKPWRSLYVSNNTVFLGGVPLSLEPGTNELQINNVPISQTINYADIPGIPADINDLTDTGGLLGGGVTSYNNLTDKPTLFSGSYNDLTNKPDLAGTYQFSVAADDSTQRLVSTDEVIKFIGTNGITTASDAEGNITISKISELVSVTVPTIGGTASASEAGITYLTNALSKWAIFTEGAFTVGEWTDVQIGWTVTDNNGFTDTIAGRGSFGAASFQTTVNNWPSPASGKTYVFTSPGGYQQGYTNPIEITVGNNNWAFGNDGSLTFPNGTTQTTAPELFSFSVAGDDSTQRAIGNNELIKFVGAGGITTASDAEGYITITQGTTSSLVNGEATVSLNSSGELTLPTGISNTGRIINDNAISFKVDNSYWVLSPDGTLTLPIGGTVSGNDDINITVNSEDSSSYTWNFGQTGNLTLPVDGDLIIGEDGRWIKDCGNSSGTTSMRWINVPVDNDSTQLIRVYSGDPAGDGDSNERAQIRLNWLDEDRSGLTIRAYDRTDSEDTVTHNWTFQGDGGLSFPDGSVQTTAYTVPSGPLYVIVNDSKEISTSTNGEIWTTGQELNTSAINFQRVAVGTNAIVYIGQIVDPNDNQNDEDAVFYQTTIGENATAARVTQFEIGAYDFREVIWAEGRFVLVGHTIVEGPNEPVLFTSTNGIDWTATDIDPVYLEIFGTNEFDDVYYDGTGFLITATGGTENGAGGFYVTDPTSALGENNFVPFVLAGEGEAVSVEFEELAYGGTGWIARAENDILHSFTGEFTPGGQPAEWTPLDVATPFKEFCGLDLEGDGNNDPGIIELEGGVIDGTYWIIFTTSEGHVGATSDLGANWTFSIPEPYTATMSFVTIDEGGITSIALDNELRPGEKITISNSEIPGLDGTYYVDNPGDSTNANILYTDSALTIPKISQEGGTPGESNVVTLGVGMYLDAASVINGFMYVANDDEQIFRSTDGATWTKVDDQNDNFSYWNDIGYNPQFEQAGLSSSLTNGEYSLTLESNGVVTLPAGGAIAEGVVTDNPTIELTPANPDDASQKLVIKGGQEPADYHLHLTTGDLETTSIILGTDEHNVRTTVDGSIQLNSQNYNTNEQHTLIFDNNGNLKSADGVPLQILSTGSNGAVGMGWSSSVDSPENIALVIANSPGGTSEAVDIVVGTLAEPNIWTFSPDGSLTLPGDIKSESAINIDINLSDSTLRRWQFGEDGNLNIPGDIITSTGTVLQSAQRVEGSWTVTAGTNTYSFTLPSDGTYTMWVKGNIPNGIIVWNATASVSNTNVPAIGQQYAWNYTGGGTPISLTSIPDQIKGVAGTISTDATYAGTTSNRFDFGISNTSGESQTVYYGYTKI
jgi:hypothetical protein